MGKSFDFIKSCGTFFISTINNGLPATRPFGAIMEYDGNLFITTSKEKDVYKQVIKNPNIQIVAYKFGTRKWLRINGEATESKSLHEKQLMINECPILLSRFQSVENNKLILFKINIINSTLFTEQSIRILSD